MNKKIYQKPAIKVNELVLESAILAGSGNVSAGFDNDIIENGNVDARPRPAFQIWDREEEWRHSE